jgi:integrase
MRDIRDTDISALGNKVYPGAKPQTLVRHLYGPMQAIWNKGVEAKLAAPRVIAKPKLKKRPPPKYPRDDWLLKVMAAMTTLPQRASMLFMSFSGARATEVISVLARDYDPSTARVTLHDTKTGDPREVQLPLFVNEALKLLSRDDPDARLFGYASRFSLTRILKRACKRASVTYYSPHRAGRHAFAARFLADGHSLKALMEGGGWKSLNAVAVYSHLERSHVDRAMAEVTTPLSTVLAQWKPSGPAQ